MRLSNGGEGQKMLSDRELRSLGRLIEGAVYAALERQRAEALERENAEHTRWMEMQLRHTKAAMDRLNVPAFTMTGESDES